MADFKVGDKVQVRKDAMLYWPSSVPRDEIGTVVSLDRDADALVSFPGIPRGWFVLLSDLELVSPADSHPPDPRDAEIAALKAEIERLKSRIAGLMLECVRKGPVLTLDDDRLYYRQLAAEMSNGLMGCWNGTTEGEKFSDIIERCAAAVFEKVKRREAKCGAS